ncbi:uncharacterized protein GGS22DRAFT_149986, partial [Annulohypoxylon maeteangense]|uniref:uncharacterized protein n=1 Tax=Annulohypoxylon maeteangense TaxID=1927788 RepID=UPI002008762D
MDFIPDSPVNNSTPVESENNAYIKQKRALQRITEEPVEPVLEAATTNQVSMPNKDITRISPDRVPLNPPEADAQPIPEEQPQFSALISSETKKQTKEVNPKALLEREISDSKREVAASRTVQPSTTGGLLGKVQANNYVDDHPKSPVEEVYDRIRIMDEEEITIDTRLSKRKHASLPSPCTSFDQQIIHMGDRQKGLSKTNVYVDQSRDGRVLAKEHQLYPEPKIQHQRHATPVAINTRSMVSESGSPLSPSKPKVVDVGISKRNSLHELQQPINYEERLKLTERPHISANHDISWPVYPSQITSDFEPRLLKADVPPPARRVTPQASKLTRQKPLDRLENYRPMPQVLSPSSSIQRPAKCPEDTALQAPRLDPRSLDFARRVAQEQKERGPNQVDEYRPGKEKYQVVKEPSWVQSKSAVMPWDASRPSLSEADNSREFLDKRSPRRHERKPGNQAPKPEYETKWQEAVDAASGGVVDTLHFISTVKFLFPSKQSFHNAY